MTREVNPDRFEIALDLRATFVDFAHFGAWVLHQGRQHIVAILVRRRLAFSFAVTPAPRAMRPEPAPHPLPSVR